MAELTPAEKMLSEKGVCGYFLGDPVDGKVAVAKHIREVALPQLRKLIVEAADPVFDSLSQRALELAVFETPEHTRMSWLQFCRYFEMAIHGPDRFSQGLGVPKETAETTKSFSDLLRAFRSEYATDANR